jgi:hypothetical protein
MTKKTTHNLIFASVYFVTVGSVFGYGLYTINAQSVKLEQLQSEHKSALQKEQSFSAITRIIESTAADRKELMSFFVTERDTISYITQIERMANAVGVTLETTSLTITPKNEKQKTEAYLGAGFRVEGTKAAVDAFMYRMDHAPFQQTIIDMSVSSNDDSANGVVQVQVQLLP